MRRALALRMGYPRRILSRLMTYAEFLDWAQHFAKQPFDDEGLVITPTAMLQASIHNAAVKDPKYLLQPSDFLPAKAEVEIDIDRLIMSKL